MKEFVMSPNCPLYNDIKLDKHEDVKEGGTEGTRRRIVEFGVLLSNLAHSAHGIKDPNASDLLKHCTDCSELRTAAEGGVGHFNKRGYYRNFFSLVCVGGGGGGN